MKSHNNMVDAMQLREWLDRGVPVFVLDIRPASQREEWRIPGSHHLDAYRRLNEGDSSVLNEIEIPENTKIVTVCAAGRTSQLAADVLRNKGVDAISLEGGMKAWSIAWNIAKLEFENFEVKQVRRTGKGCLSYIVSSANEALIIDASLPVEVYVQMVDESNLSVKNVIETHIHADHLSRSKAVADYFKVPLFLPVPNKVRFTFKPILSDTVFAVGSIALRTLSAPGHTLESVSFYIANSVVFTGDTLFTNSIGRPDLKASEDESRKKSALLYHSLKKLLALPDSVCVFPAHTSMPVEFDKKMIYASMEVIKKNIPVLQRDETEFISFLLKRIPPPPDNYLSIVEKNLTGDFSEVDAINLEAGANRCAIS